MPRPMRRYVITDDDRRATLTLAGWTLASEEPEAWTHPTCVDGPLSLGRAYRRWQSQPD